MGIAEDMVVFEEKLNELVRKYEQYFLGIEKREPIKLLEEIERIARRYSATTIVNTMVKFKYNSLVARLQSYKQYWNRIIREIEEGRYSRDKFRMGMHRKTPPPVLTPAAPAVSHEFDCISEQYLEARKTCKLGTDSINPATLKATLEKQKEALRQKYNCTDIEFHVVVEEGKPKIKARPKR